MSTATAGVSPMSDVSFGALCGAIGAVVAGIFAWLVQRSRGESDIEVAVIGEWQKLNAALSVRLSAVEKEFAEHRTTVAKQFEELRAQHAREIDEMRKQHRAEMRVQRDLNEGLQRQIAQNSHSTAQLLGEFPKRDSDNGK